ncbi:hypothetical protein BJY01DRAFT_212339 [Aspergillus pseudoustus]|uniref:EthD domain-containing protein n=1 Tax=Aspergillus pseudoustus TaxID=1810923 RepID=A0ABR4K6A0_9EURO
MVYALALLCRRKAGLTPAEFKTHFETEHVLLIKRLTGEFFPQSHQRFYIQRGSAEPHAAQMFVGDETEYDAICIMTWADESVAQKYFARVQEPHVLKQVMDDDAAFVERASTKIVALEDLRVTSG